MTQSAVSQQIKSLENALGRTLFYRRVRGLELTDEGRGYLPSVQAAFATLEEGTAVLVGRNDPDVLELHANLSFALFWLSPRLGRFMQEFPWVQLNVATSIWPQEKPTGSAAVEIVFGQGKWESRVGQRLTRDSLFPVCTPEVGARIRAPLQDGVVPELHIVRSLGRRAKYEIDDPYRGPDRWIRTRRLSDFDRLDALGVRHPFPGL